MVAEQIAAGDPQQNQPDVMGGVLVLLQQLPADLGVQRREKSDVLFDPCPEGQADRAEAADRQLRAISKCPQACAGRRGDW